MTHGYNGEMISGDFQCEICQSMVFDGEEHAQLDHESIQNICILCASAAEKLGWRIIV
jgi:hypothetical protein